MRFVREFFMMVWFIFNVIVKDEGRESMEVGYDNDGLYEFRY